MLKINKKNNNSTIFAANAKIVEKIDLEPNVAISRWRIENNSINYNKHDSHTLSLYLKGGESSFRADQPFNKGAPGKLTLMPQNHKSDWKINGEIEFIHLYFTDTILKKYAAVNFDCDIRYVDLQDLTYKKDIQLQKLFLEYYQIYESHNYIPPLFSEQMLYNIFHHIISQYNSFGIKAHKIRGGLSAFHIRKIKSMINDCLSEQLTIDRLAKEIGLSHFHFAKMFKLSFGEPPGCFISRLRIERVKQYLKTKSTISEISASTGFSQQSHMTHQFKKMTGMTPSIYRTHSI
jgi:AraC family transcriptional regulator